MLIEIDVRILLVTVVGLIKSTLTVLPYEMSISILDGQGETECRSKLEKMVSGLAGIIYSHQPYGSSVYGEGKNCILMIFVPIGYRIRLTVLEFNVNNMDQNNNNNNNNQRKDSLCEKDTLHVFDTDEIVNERETDREPGSGLGRIVGQFCGRKPNKTHLVSSSHNALTLWWHTDSSTDDDGEKSTGGPNPQIRNNKIRPLSNGFRLLWSAFRNASNAGCSRRREFQCANYDCIPIELACDRTIANCADNSDLDTTAQNRLGCENLTTGGPNRLLFPWLHGTALLALCLALVLGSVACCVILSICCRKKTSPKGDTSLNGTTPVNSNNNNNNNNNRNNSQKESPYCIAQRNNIEKMSALRKSSPNRTMTSSSGNTSGGAAGPITNSEKQREHYQRKPMLSDYDNNHYQYYNTNANNINNSNNNNYNNIISGCDRQKAYGSHVTRMDRETRTVFKV